jgi:hypothetical protein
MSAQRVIDLFPCCVNHLVRVHPSKRNGDTSRIDASHLQDVAEQPREPLQSRERDVDLAVALRLAQCGDPQIPDRRADRGERRAQVVSKRRQQGRFDLHAASRQLGSLAMLQQPDALDRDRDDAGHGAQGRGLDPAAATDVASATHNREAAAMNRINSRYDSATVVALVRCSHEKQTAVMTPRPRIAAAACGASTRTQDLTSSSILAKLPESSESAGVLRLAVTRPSGANTWYDCRAYISGADQ